MTRNTADPFRDWDAAYVLGALVPSERQEYERHLAHCQECSAAVAELAGLPGILGTLPTEEALTVAGPAGRPPESEGAASAADADPQSSPDALRGLSARVRGLRLRSRALAAALTVAACAASVGITVAVTRTDVVASQPQAAATQLRFSPVAASSLSATGTLEPEAWGTRIDWRCTYARHAQTADPAGGRYSTPPTAAERGYALLVTDVHGNTSRVATWVATPGSVVTPTATTRIPATHIRRVEIRATATGQTLLAATP